jgi:endoglucanase
MKKLCMIWGLLPAVSLLACGGPLPEDADDLGNQEGALLSGALPYRGVNLAGAEFAVDPSGNGALPGTFGSSYVYPDPKYVPGYNSASYFVGKGMTAFRLPFRWERLQPTRKAAFNAAEQDRLTTTTNDLLAKGAAVILDPHNYARYGTSLIGSGAVPNADFADFWGRLATLYKSNSKVVFDIMNEPHDMSTEQWVGAANAAIAAIRATGATNLIIVPGNGWDGAHSWSQNWYGTANSTAMLQIKDPGNNYAYEVHQYLDDTSSGSSPNCTSSTIGSQRLAGFTSWLKANGKRGFLGEFNGGRSATCVAALDDMFKHMEANSSVWLGWTFWAAGPWWGNDVIEPNNNVNNGNDDVRMTMMLPHLAWGGGGGSGSGSGTSTSTSGSGSGGGPVCTAATYEAETMTHSNGGTTSGGWNLWMNGYVSTKGSFVAGPTHITVSASGQPAAGVWPHMVVSVDGMQIGQATVSASSWASFSFPYAATAGSHEIKVSYDNDYNANGQDRNLLVDKVSVSCN